MSELRQSALAWEVELPGKRLSTLGATKPKGTVTVRGPQGSEERIFVPKAVAVALDAKRRSGELLPQSSSALRQLVDHLSRTCARARIERLLDRREYSSDEVRRKLREDGYRESVVDDCVKRACEAGLISNERYADSFIRSKLQAGWGMGRIRRELSQRGVDVDTLPGWPYEYLDPEEELERACAVAATRHVAGAHAFERLVRFLCGRGFTMDVALRAARETLAGESAAEDDSFH